jgi:effector-binding domain-containing protein
MKRIIRLTEIDLTRIVKRTIMEMEEDGEKFKLSPEHLIKDLNHNVDKFIKSKDLDEEESFRRLDYFIQRDLKPILNKAEEKGLWADEEIEYIIRYLKIAYNYDYYSGKQLPPPDYIY